VDHPGPAPRFSSMTPGGEKMGIDDFKGKLVVLNFWATWCPPCRLEMPSMERLYQEFKGEGLEVVAMITSSQAGRLAKKYDKAQLIFIAFVMCGIGMIAVPFMPTAGLVAVPLFFYGLANGVISPMQKSLLIQNAAPELRGGIVSVDRLIQQFSKTLSTSVVGLLLLVTKISTIFWFLGALSFVSVGLMAMVLPRR